MAVKPLQSVETTLRVLEAVSEHHPVGVSALARELDLDKNAVQRSLVTLGQQGWIRQLSDETGAWELTGKALSVGRRYAPGLEERSRPHLESLQDRTGETALLFSRDQSRMVLLDAVESTQALKLTVPIGTVVRLARVGGFDAFLTDAERSALPRGDHPVTEQAVAATRRAGFYVLDDVYPSSITIGAPIYDARERAIGSILVVAPRLRLARSERRRVGVLVRAAAAAVSSES